MSAVLEFVLRLIRLVIGGVLLVSVALICANAFGRYVLAAPVIWAEEVLGYALVWMVYLGAVLVTWDSGHLRMDLLVRGLPRPLRRAADLFGAAAFLAVGGLIVWQARDSIAEFSHRSQVANLPMDVVHAVIPFSFALVVICVVLRALSPLPEDTGPTASRDRSAAS